MDKAKILRLCNEIEETVNELAECCEIIDLHTHTMLIDKLRGIGAEISAKPKTNADRIRAMTDDELADFLDNISRQCSDDGGVCYHCELYNPKCHGCNRSVIYAKLREEVSEDAG